MVWTVGEIVLAPASMAAAAELSPDHARGRYQGMYGFAWAAAACVAPVASGQALETVGPAALWGASAAIGALAAAGYYTLLRGLARAVGLSSCSLAGRQKEGRVLRRPLALRRSIGSIGPRSPRGHCPARSPTFLATTPPTAAPPEKAGISPRSPPH
ncbi:hypothetical protein ACFWA5_33430 [Streptomyces mirabilis]|uniref:hypothetical protein n=1 Tax=Streptomyces mirabilis TaxID=68239 RepID=UPI0036535B34